jgi:hypothetical protein
MWNAISDAGRRGACGAIAVLLLWAALGHTAVSINLPLDDPAYPLLEKLVRSHVTFSNALTIKPITRLYAAQLIIEATRQRQDELATVQRQDPFVDQTLQYLVSRFQRELRQLGFLYQQRRPEAYELASLVELKVELSGAHDPFVHRDSSGMTPNLQGVFGLHEGFAYGDDFSMRLRTVSWGTWWPHLAVYVEPEFIVRSDPLLGDVFDANLFKGYVKAGAANLELTFGRDTLWWGPAAQGDLVLSNNAPPLELLKLSTPVPFRLPWVFRSLGEWQVAYVIARLEKDRAIPHALVSGLRVALQPMSYIQLGFTNVIQAYGEGGVSVGALEFIPQQFVPVFDITGRTVNGLVAYNLVLTLPWVPSWLQSVQFYWQRGNDNVANVWDVLGGGNLIGGVIDGRRWDLRLEYAETRDADRASTIWYNHPTYQSGFAFRKFILGHPIGGDAESLFGRVTYYLTPTIWLAVDGRHERYGVELQPTSTTQWRYGIEASYQLAWQQHPVVLWGRFEYAMLDPSADHSQRAIIVQFAARWRF